MGTEIFCNFRGRKELSSCWKFKKASLKMQNINWAFEDSYNLCRKRKA